MEQEDLELEQRVWQRIGGGEISAGEIPEPEEMLVLAEQTANTLRAEARVSGGSRREMLTELARHCGAHADALRGMALLQAGQPRQSRRWAAAREPGALPRAYRNLQQLRSAFARCAGSPEFGSVFHGMAHTAGEDLYRLLTLIGSTNRA